MPKEYINNRWYGDSVRTHKDCDTRGEPHCPPDCQGSLIAMDDSAVKIGWTKDEMLVQVAVVTDRDRADGTDPDDDAYHASFDRTGINRMINALRKARDAAFGKDA
jgi:hypothetical protein